MRASKELNELLDSKDYSPPGPKEPTSAKPGSKEKIAVLAGRFDRGESLWHEDDLILRDGDGSESYWNSIACGDDPYFGCDVYLDHRDGVELPVTD